VDEYDCAEASAVFSEVNFYDQTCDEWHVLSLFLENTSKKVLVCLGDNFGKDFGLIGGGDQSVEPLWEWGVADST